MSLYVTHIYIGVIIYNYIFVYVSLYLECDRLSASVPPCDCSVTFIFYLSITPSGNCLFPTQLGCCHMLP
jgi:hypothetical protein